MNSSPATGRVRRSMALVGVVALAVGAVVGTSSLSGTASAGADGYAGGWPTQLLAESSDRIIARSDGRHGDHRVIRVEYRELRAAEVDVDGDGVFDPGDSFVFEERLRNPRTGALVGRDAAECGRIVNQFHCEATFVLDGRGKITVAGAFFRGEQQLDIPITGGTGAFSDASGTFSLADNDVLVFSLND